MQDPMVEQKKASSGNHYTIIYKGEATTKFTTKRPDKKDKTILCCIAAAFTRLDDGKVDGVYAIEGKVSNIEFSNYHLGGGILLNDKGCEIFPIKLQPSSPESSKIFPLSPELQKKITEGKYSFFQQIQLIVNGKAEKFKDTQLFQRRAVVILNDKKVAIIESAEPITLAAFSTDLVELGAYNALYTDMGAWDEGWYRTDKGIKIIGTSKSQTEKQSNWVVFVK